MMMMTMHTHIANTLLRAHAQIQFKNNNTVTVSLSLIHI